MGDYPYYWRVKTRLPERKGQPCRVLVRGAMNSCLVEFEDGFKVVTSRNYVRKIIHSLSTDGGEGVHQAFETVGERTLADGQGVV